MPLPIEVFEAVIDQSSDDVGSLRDLPLTCATFLPRSRNHLFIGIRIQTVEQMESSRDFFDAHPWLLPLIRKVTLAVRATPSNKSKPNLRVLDIVPVHLLTRLPNLRAWSIQQTSSSGDTSLSLHRSALSLYRSNSSRIQTLDLGCEIFRLSDFTGLVSSFTSIHTLACDNVTFRRKDEVEGTCRLTRQPQLSTLVIGPGNDIRVVEYMLACGSAALRSLSLRLWGDLDELEELIMGQLSQLSSLKLVISRLGHEDIQNFSRTIRSTIRILKSIGRTSLTDLEVDFELQTFAALGSYFSGGPDALSEDCRLLEEALLVFPNLRVLFRDWSGDKKRRAGRAELWLPIIECAFPMLKKRGSLIFNFTRSRADSLDPTGHELSVTSLVASHDSRWVVTASLDDTIIIWDASSGKALHECVAHQGGIVALALSPDSRQLVSAGRHKTVVVWAIDNGVQKVAALEGHTDIVETCTWSPGGVLIATASKDRTVRVWDGHTFQRRNLFLDHDPPKALRCSPDSRYLAWISGNDCRVWRPLIEEEPRRLPSHPDRSGVHTSALTFDPESRRIATAHGNSDDDDDACVVRIRDTATGAVLAVLTGFSRLEWDISFSPDGRSLLSGSENRYPKIWDAESGEQLALLENNSDPYRVSEAHFSPDGKYIATGSYGGGVVLWRVGDQSRVAIACEYRHPARSIDIVFTPCGEFLASVDEGIVQIHLLSNFIGH